MRILIAEDDPVSRKILEANLTKWDYDVLVTSDGNEAWEVLTAEDAPNIAVLDWMMPGMDGVKICDELRKAEKKEYIYIILLTAKGNKEDIVRGLESGADDYIIKPFDKSELKARVRVGVKTIELKLSLRAKISELKEALDNINKLQGIVPICAWCKRIRDDSQYWHQVEDYIAEHSLAEFSHSICPECSEKYYSKESAPEQSEQDSEESSQEISSNSQ